MYETRIESLLKAIKAGDKKEIEAVAKSFDMSGELDVSRVTPDDKRLAGFLLDHLASLRREIVSVEALEKLGRLRTILGAKESKPIIYVPKLRMRLKRFSFEEIEQAAKNIAENGFMMGNEDGEKKATLEYLLRNDQQIDKWLTKKNGNGTANMEEMRRVYRNNGVPH
jgi:hypothetical protein